MLHVNIVPPNPEKTFIQQFIPKELEHSRYMVLQEEIIEENMDLTGSTKRIVRPKIIFGLRPNLTPEQVVNQQNSFSELQKVSGRKTLVDLLAKNVCTGIMNRGVFFLSSKVDSDSTIGEYLVNSFNEQRVYVTRGIMAHSPTNRIGVLGAFGSGNDGDENNPRKNLFRSGLNSHYIEVFKYKKDDVTRLLLNDSNALTGIVFNATEKMGSVSLVELFRPNRIFTYGFRTKQVNRTTSLRFNQTAGPLVLSMFSRQLCDICNFSRHNPQARPILQGIFIFGNGDFHANFSNFEQHFRQFFMHENSPPFRNPSFGTLYSNLAQIQNATSVSFSVKNLEPFLVRWRQTLRTPTYPRPTPEDLFLRSPEVFLHNIFTRSPFGQFIISNLPTLLETIDDIDYSLFDDIFPQGTLPSSFAFEINRSLEERRNYYFEGLRSKQDLKDFSARLIKTTGKTTTPEELAKLEKPVPVLESNKNAGLTLNCMFSNSRIPESILQQLGTIPNNSIGLIDFARSRFDSSGFSVIRIFNSMYGLFSDNSSAFRRVPVVSLRVNVFELIDSNQSPISPLGAALMSRDLGIESVGDIPVELILDYLIEALMTNSERQQFFSRLVTGWCVPIYNQQEEAIEFIMPLLSGNGNWFELRNLAQVEQWLNEHSSDEDLNGEDPNEEDPDPRREFTSGLMGRLFNRNKD